MRKVLIIMLIICTSLLSGCMPEEYPFPNKDQPIEKVELLYNPAYGNNAVTWDSMENICILDSENADAFLRALYDIETHKCITPPSSGYGFYVARVVYQNGDVEMFGSRHIEFIKKGDSPKEVGAYSFSKEEFEKLFFEYVATFGDSGVVLLSPS